MKRFRIINEEKGAILPIVAIAIATVIAGFAVITIDTGYLFDTKIQMETAADAGALAGAKVLSENGGTNVNAAIQTAVEVAKKNGATDINPSNVSVGTRPLTLEDGSVEQMQVIEVTSKVNKELFFAKIFGQNDTDVAAKSVATWGNIITDGGVVPLIVHEDSLEGGIVAGKHLSIGAPGNWGLLEGLTDSQVKKILSGDESFQLPYSENNVYTTEPGNIKAFTVPGIEDRMKSVRNLPVDERKDAMTIIFPVVGGIINGRSDVTVKYYVSGLVKDVIVKHATGSEWALGDDFKRIKGPGKDYRNIISGLPNQAAGFIVVEFIEFIQLDELNVGDGIQGGQVGSGDKYQKLIKP